MANPMDVPRRKTSILTKGGCSFCLNLLSKYPNYIFFAMSVRFDPTKILQLLTCPVEQTPLTEAVTLRCAHNHRMNLSTCVGKDFPITANIKCDVCQDIASGYDPDPMVRGLVGLFLSKVYRLPVSPLVLEKEDELLFYESERGNFRCLRDDWDRECKIPGHEKQIMFVNIGSGVIKYCTLMKDQSEELRLEIRVNNFSQWFCRYLQKRKIAVIAFDDHITVYTIHQIRALFHIVQEHNNFPGDYAGRLEKIIYSHIPSTQGVECWNEEQVLAFWNLSRNALLEMN
jgi:hypothetical protein